MQNIYPYKTDEYIIKQYDEDTFRIIQIKSIKEKGLETLTQHEENVRFVEKYIFPKPKKKNASGRLDESISRTKSKIYDYARCNDWQYFVTLTLDPKKINRYEIKPFMVKFNRMISDENKKRETKIKYLLVPEKHKNNAVHFHGFIMGLLPTDIRLNKNNHEEWSIYADKFGFTTISPIRSIEAASAYCKKYITKDLRSTIQEQGANMYYHSKGLKLPMVVYRGQGTWAGTEDIRGFFKDWDFVQEDGYCRMVTVNKQQYEANFKKSEVRDYERERQQKEKWQHKENYCCYIDTCCNCSNEQKSRCSNATDAARSALCASITGASMGFVE